MNAPQLNGCKGQLVEWHPQNSRWVLSLSNGSGQKLSNRAVWLQLAGVMNMHLAIHETMNSCVACAAARAVGRTCRSALTVPKLFLVRASCQMAWCSTTLVEFF